MDKNHILIVEDDADIRSGIEIYLKNQGYDVSQAGDGIEGLAVIEKEEIDLAIVDIMMPRMDGITMMMKVREKGYDFPVIMLSAKSEEVDKIMGLNMGADDYITKPFTPLELLARVNSHLRRYNRYREAIASAEPVKDTYHVLGGIELNEETVEVFVDGAPVRLTPIETCRNQKRLFQCFIFHRCPPPFSPAGEIRCCPFQQQMCPSSVRRALPQVPALRCRLFSFRQPCCGSIKFLSRSATPVRSAMLCPGLLSLSS